MAKKKQSESVATKFTMVLRPRTPTTGKEKVNGKARRKMPKFTMVLRPRTPTTGKEKVKEKARRKMPVKVDNKAKAKKTVVRGKIKNGNAAKRKLSIDEGNTEVAGSRVKKLKAVTKKNEMDKGAETGSTRVCSLNSAKKGDQSGKKEFKKESAEAKTKKLKRNILVKKEASPAIRSPMPKKSLPAKASKRITTRKGGMSEDPISEERASDTVANKIRTVQGFKKSRNWNQQR